MKRCGWPSRAESSLRSALVPEARSQRRRGLACVVVVLVLEICYKWWDARHLKIQCPLSETSSSASVRAGAGRRHVRTILQLPSVVQHADVLHSRCRYRCRCTTRTAGILHAVSVWAHVAYRNNGNTARISCKYVLTWFFSNLLNWIRMRKEWNANIQVAEALVVVERISDNISLGDLEANNCKH